MGDVGELAVRMVVSLGAVLGLVAVAYGVARRRQGSRGRSRSMRRKVRTPAPALEVEARTGLARGASAVAVRFADRIVLIGVTDGAASTVLADIPAEEWDRPPEPIEDPSVPSTDEDDRTDAPTGPFASQTIRTPLDPNGIVSERPSFLDALRDATSRRP